MHNSIIMLSYYNLSSLCHYSVTVTIACQKKKYIYIYILLALNRIIVMPQNVENNSPNVIKINIKRNIECEIVMLCYSFCHIK